MSKPCDGAEFFGQGLRNLPCLLTYSLLTAAIVFLCGPFLVAAPIDDQLDAARDLLKIGRYDEATEACRGILTAGDSPSDAKRDATLLLSSALETRGLVDTAATVVTDRLRDRPRDASLLARQSELEFRRGDYADAEDSAGAALKIDPGQLRARLVQAHVFTETGRLDDALEGYQWFVGHYNRSQPTDAESLLLIAEGSLQYARWKSVSDIFDFVINTLCPDALADDPHCWQAAHLSGRVLLEKYNRPQAIEELEAALKINPRAAEVMVSLGEAAMQVPQLERAIELAQQALKVNPRLPSALRLAADVSLASGDFKAAKTFIDSALAVNPYDQRTLALQAAMWLLEEGIPESDEFRSMLGITDKTTEPRAEESEEDLTRFESLWRELTERNPAPGVFLTQLGEMLDGRRKYAAAEVCYRRAIEVMPQLSQPRTELGMLLMRTGKLDEAAAILDAAFKADPYHVRVSNMRKVIRQLNGYQAISSDHFVIRVPEEERILGEEMSRYLEEIYGELTTKYGFEPETRTQFEVYGAASGQSAHQWFSARMVGLPWVQTIGASTGMIVAMASPHDQPEPFNWARVVRHEFVHIITLQQTDFNMPHWYTEALAVRTEGTVPQSWDTLLLERVPAGEVFSLEDINQGFTRPDGPTDWNMAYCQSWLYAQYLAKRFGESALNQLSDAYRRNLTTPEAIEDVCEITVEEFERGYTDFLNAHVAKIRRTRVSLPPEMEAASRRWKEHPDDRDAWADVAWALWNHGRRREAREMAEEIIAESPSQPFAVAILAESAIEEGELKHAERMLQPAFNSGNPHPAILESLALLKVEQEDWPAARKLWEQAVERWPREPNFLRGLAATLLRQDDNARLKEVLTIIARLDADDGLIRKKLAHMATAAEQWSEAVRWGEESLHCDVRDATTHRLLAKACEQMGDSAAAARHTEFAQRLESQ